MHQQASSATSDAAIALDTNVFHQVLSAMVAQGISEGLDQHAMRIKLQPILFPDQQTVDTDTAAAHLDRSPATLERWRWLSKKDNRLVGPPWIKDTQGRVRYELGALERFRLNNREGIAA